MFEGLIIPIGLKPSLANPNLTLCGSAIKDEYFESRVF